jgi:hypothetical protein
VSVRGGLAATRAAHALGFSVVSGTEALRRADLLVIDDPSPTHGRNWAELARRRGLRCVSVHDGPGLDGVDLWVNGSVTVSSVPRDEAFSAAQGGTGRTDRRKAAGPGVGGPTTTVLEGTQFYILDHRISAARRRRERGRRRSCKSVLVALGGGHHVRLMAQRLAEALGSRCPGVDVRIASGFAAGQLPRLPYGRWVIARRGLIAPLAACDVAIVGGGVTLYEACALGVPAVGLAVVPAQMPAIEAFARQGAVIDAGGPAGSPEAIGRAAAGVARLLRDERARARTSHIAQRLVDGRGARRVARHVRAVLAMKTNGLEREARGA